LNLGFSYYGVFAPSAPVHCVLSQSLNPLSHEGLDIIKATYLLTSLCVPWNPRVRLLASFPWFLVFSRDMVYAYPESPRGLAGGKKYTTCYLPSSNMPCYLTTRCRGRGGPGQRPGRPGSPRWGGARSSPPDPGAASRRAIAAGPQTRRVPDGVAPRKATGWA